MRAAVVNFGNLLNLHKITFVSRVILQEKPRYQHPGSEVSIVTHLQRTVLKQVERVIRQNKNRQLDLPS